MVVKKIESAILELGSSEFETLCVDLIVLENKNYKIQRYGSTAGSNKTKKGIPDAYSNSNKNNVEHWYMFSLQRTDIKNKIESEKIKCIEKIKKNNLKNVKSITFFICNDNLSPEFIDNFINNELNLKIEIRTINEIANLIFLKYRHLSTIHLNFPIDTGQIYRIEEYKYFYKSKKEIKLPIIENNHESKITKKIEKNDVVIMNGIKGIGKTFIGEKISNNYFKQGYNTVIIKSNGKDFYEDLNHYLENKNFIFIDNAEKIKNLYSILDKIYKFKSDETKVLISYSGFEEIKLENSDLFIFEEVKINYLDRNNFINSLSKKKFSKNIIECILSITENPLICEEILKWKFQNLYINVYKHFYYNDLQKYFSSHEDRIKYSFFYFSKIYSWSSCLNEKYLETKFQITKNDLNKYEKFVIDKDFSIFILCFTLIDNKDINLSEFLEKAINPFFYSLNGEGNIINFLKTIYLIFGNEIPKHYIFNEIYKVFESNNELNYLKILFELNEEKSLNILIDIIENGNYDVENTINLLIYFIKKTNDQEIKNIILNLMFELINNNKEIENKIINKIKNELLMKIVPPNYILEMNIVNKIIEKNNYDVANNLIKYCFHDWYEDSYRWTKQGIVEYKRIKINETNELKQFRIFLLETLFKINGMYKTLILINDLLRFKLIKNKNEIDFIKNKIDSFASKNDIFIGKFINDNFDIFGTNVSINSEEGLIFEKFISEDNSLINNVSIDEFYIFLNIFNNNQYLFDILSYEEKDYIFQKFEIIFSKATKISAITLKEVLVKTNKFMEKNKTHFYNWHPITNKIIKSDFYEELLNLLFPFNNEQYYFLGYPLLFNDSIEINLLDEKINLLLDAYENNKINFLPDFSLVLKTKNITIKKTIDIIFKAINNKQNINLFLAISNDGIEKLFNIIEEKNKLETILLKCKIQNSHYLVYLLSINNIDFLKKYLKNNEIENYEYIEIFTLFWNDKKYENYINLIYEELSEFDKKFIFFKTEKENIKNRQISWIKKYIYINKDNQYKISEIFSVIFGFNLNIQLELILYFIKENTEIDIFNIVISRYTYYNEEEKESAIMFLEELKNKIKELGFKYSKHVLSLKNIIKNS